MTTSRRGHLAAVPARPPRVIGIIRVSKERDGMVSPEIQRTASSDYAAAMGYEIVDWVEAMDDSGSQERSAWWSTLDRTIKRLEAGEVEGIIGWKFSRFGRRRLKWATAVDRIETAGGFLESATEQFDTRTATGRLARGMTAEFNAFQAELIGESWREAHNRRIASGRPSTGKPRYGYAYDKTQKLHVPEPETGQLLASVYRRYIAGESVYSLVRWLNAHGHRTLSGGLWSDTRLRTVLDSGFAAGKFMAGGDPKRKIKPHLHDGIHEPLITGEEWQAYVDVREERRNRPARYERSQYLLSGMVRCADCGKPMLANTAAVKDQRNGPRYRCHAGKVFGEMVCVGGHVAAWKVEDAVRQWLEEKASQVDRSADGDVVRPSRIVALEADEQRLGRDLARVDESMTRLVLQNVEHPLPATVYANAIGELEERRSVLAQALEQVQRDRRRAPEDAAVRAAGLLGEWDVLGVAQRREILRAGLLDCVLVRTGREPFLRVVEWSEVRS